MKRSNKVLLIAGLATATIGTAGILHINYKKQPEEIATKMQTYNHQPNNILDNVFEKNNVTYLPFIFDNPDQTITKDKIISEFAKKGLTITSISTDNKIVTGTQIKVKENSEVYTVIVYGDANGDGEVNVFDAQECVDDFVNDGKNLKGAYKIAANVENSDNEVNVFDAQRIVDFYVGIENKLVKVEPTSLKEADKIAPVITIKGDKTIELEEGATYTDEGATALDNYDGDLTSEITRIIEFVAEGTTQKVKVGQVDTSKVGTYTITYSVEDSNKNPSAAIRTVIIKAKEVPPIPEKAVESIELSLDTNFKTEYQYGEATTIDLTGAKIVVTYEDKTTDTINIAKSMLSAYDLTTAGQKEITVTYGEKTAPTKINVKVLNPISELIMNNTGMNNAQETADGYQTNSKEDFILGTIQAKQETDGSTLQQNQLKVTTTVTPTDDSTVTTNDLTVNFETDASGNIIIKGKAEKVGAYTIKAYIEYGSQKVEKSIQLVVKKSDVVKEVKVEPTEENEVIKVGSVAKRKLTVININGEEINVTSGNVKIIEKEGVTITKLNAAGKFIGQNDTEEVVDSLQIATTLETEQTIKMNMEINGEAADFTFSIKAKSILTSVEIAEKSLDIYAVLPDNEENVIPGLNSETAGNIYTLITPVFKDQYGEEMTIKASDIVASEGENDINKAIQSGKIGILLPEVEAKHTGIPVEVPGNCIDFRCYNNGAFVSGENEISQITFSVILNNPDQTVNLTKLAQAKVVIKCGNSEDIELPIKVHYKKLTNLGINTSTITLAQDDEGNYTTKLNEKFTLGTITVGAGETPATADELTTEIVGDKSGITISYTADADGNIVVKGRVSKEGVYQIKPKVGDVVGIGIDIKGISIPRISNIELEDFELQIGEQTQKDFIAISDINPTGQPIKAKDITFEQKDKDGTVNDLEIQLLDERNLPIYTEPVGDGQGNNAARPDAIVKKINVKAKETIAADKQIKLTITVFKDQENKYPKTITVSTYQPVPRSIVIGNTVNLYDAHIEGTTVQGSDGLVYTLLPVELFADVDNTRKIAGASNLFTTEEQTKQNKVYIQLPEVTGYLIAGEQQIPAGQQQVLEVKYFNAAKDEAVKEIAYVGIAMIELSGITYNKSDLNGQVVNCIIGDTTPATITLNYTPNN